MLFKLNALVIVATSLALQAVAQAIPDGPGAALAAPSPTGTAPVNALQCLAQKGRLYCCERLQEGESQTLGQLGQQIQPGLTNVLVPPGQVGLGCFGDTSQASICAPRQVATCCFGPDTTFGAFIYQCFALPKTSGA